MSSGSGLRIPSPMNMNGDARGSGAFPSKRMSDVFRRGAQGVISLNRMAGGIGGLQTNSRMSGVSMGMDRSPPGGVGGISKNGNAGGKSGPQLLGTTTSAFTDEAMGVTRGNTLRSHKSSRNPGSERGGGGSSLRTHRSSGVGSRESARLKAIGSLKINGLGGVQRSGMPALEGLTMAYDTKRWILVSVSLRALA